MTSASSGLCYSCFLAVMACYNSVNYYNESCFNLFLLYLCQGTRTLWSNGMPMTISYLSITNNQLPAKRSRNTLATNGSTTITASDIQNDQFVSEHMVNNGSCYIWSTNVLALDAWLPINCSTIVAYPFIVCEKILKTNPTLLFYKRLNHQCTLVFVEFNGYCIRIINNASKKPILHLKQDAEPLLNNAVLMRILTAWTIPLFTGQRRHAINIVIWREKNKCECFTSVDTLYMEIKTWYYEKNCSCNMKYPTLAMVSQTITSTPNNIFSCDDGSFKQVVYRCDCEKDCDGNEDEQNCSHICSTYPNCYLDCTLPECTCAQLYYQCTHGGCVHQTYVCDGVVHCLVDDSDEVMCQYQLTRNHQKKRFLNDAFSLCNSFSNETYPNNEICLLTRDQYGVTEHCSNTEHLRYCVDYRCPNHYKCLESYCIPIHLVCDGIEDCPIGQDEEHCDEFSCQGYYQCKNTHMCLHLNYLCDGVVDCPLHRDDEQFCDEFQCPSNCKCIGFTVTCITVAPSTLQSIWRYKDRKAIILRSNNSLVNIANIMFKHFSWLLILNLTNTRFARNLYPHAFSHMPQLRILELSNTGIILQKGSKFKYMNSLKHIILIHSETPILYSNTFLLPTLISLDLQQSQIQYIESGAFCSMSNLKTLKLSYNKIEHISTTTFQCLDGLQNLDISDNKVTTIEEAAFVAIAVVSFSGHSTLCCYLNPTSSSQVNQRTVSSIQIQLECQSILSHHMFIRFLYFVMGATTTLISIIFIIKRVLHRNEKSNKTNQYIKAIAASDLLNGIYILLVLICNMIYELLVHRTTQRHNFLVLLYYLSKLPDLSMLTTRVEHLIFTVGMYMAICHVFSDVGGYIRVARVIGWTVSVSFCVIDIVFLRHAVLIASVVWQPYHQTDYSIMDIVSIVTITGYELVTSLANILLCTRIYTSVKRNEERIGANRIPKQHLVARRLIQLTIGRLVLTLCFVSLVVLLRSHLGLSTVVKQALIALVVPSSTVVNLLMFYNY